MKCVTCRFLNKTRPFCTCGFVESLVLYEVCVKCRFLGVECSGVKWSEVEKSEVR